MRVSRILCFVLFFLFVFVAASNAAPKEMAIKGFVVPYRLVINSDGSINVNTSSTGTVTATGTVFVITRGGADLDIRDLSSVSDSITASATDFDIRDLTSVSDSVTVTATDLDIRNLTGASDTVTATATNLDIRDLTSVSDSVTVTATDLDTRNLTAASDTVTITGTVSTSIFTTVEYKNYDIPPTSASGVNLDPAAASYIATIKNNHTATIWMKFGATPAEKNGMAITAKGSRVVDTVMITDLEFYNPDSATATIAIEYWR